MMNTESRLHGFPVVDGCLQIGGIPLTRLALRVGQTPFYAYDRSLLSARISELRRHLPAAVHLSYAIKANPMAAVLQHMATLVDGLDVASSGELALALDTTVPPERISFAGPGKLVSELRQAVAAGVTINIESWTELERLEAIGRELALPPRVAIRVNPDFELRSSGLKMGGGAKQFGVDAEQVPAMCRRIAEVDLDFQGFHLFTGSQNLKAEAVRDAQRQTVDLALRLADVAPGPVRMLNIGGGFGIPYFKQDLPLDLQSVGQGLAELVARIEERLPEARTIIELGRYLVGEAGIYVAQVVDRKVSRDQVFLVTDGGLHQHLAATGNFGQVLRRNFPVAIGNRAAPPPGGKAGPEERVSVVGCLCTPLDLLAEGVDLPRAEIGDLVVIFQSGAYGCTASPTGFLGHPKPAEVIV